MTHDELMGRLEDIQGAIAELREHIAFDDDDWKRLPDDLKNALNSTTAAIDCLNDTCEDMMMGAL